MHAHDTQHGPDTAHSRQTCAHRTHARLTDTTHTTHGTRHVHSQQTVPTTQAYMTRARTQHTASQQTPRTCHTRTAEHRHQARPHSATSQLPHPSEPPQRRRLSHTLTQQTDMTLLLEQVHEPARGDQQSDPGMWTPRPWTASCLCPIPTATMKVRHACTPGPWRVDPSLSVGWAGGSGGRAPCRVVGTRFQALLLSWPFTIHSLRIPSWN